MQFAQIIAGMLIGVGGTLIGTNFFINQEYDGEQTIASAMRLLAGVTAVAVGALVLK